MDYRPPYYQNSLSAAQKRFIKRWERMRQWHKWKYYILEGAFKEGVLLFVIVKALEFIFDFSSSIKYYNSALGVLRLMGSIVFWMALGVAFAWWKRQTYEEEYEVLKRMDK
ncbi:MAG: hypothetical protein HYR66_09705 [Sphingobacteriales bacterium]|nr:hypothetical protein [Sphingobacteriales bacterium]MBI3719063.1 hypothetical protein [Sphingobacteriales bacterium]